MSISHSVDRSLRLYQRAACQLIPGATQLISRRPTLAALGVSPIYADHAKGCRIWDVDGNEYVDWMSAVGPIILGYSDEVVDAAVKEQIDCGSFSPTRRSRQSFWRSPPSTISTQHIRRWKRANTSTWRSRSP